MVQGFDTFKRHFAKDRDVMDRKDLKPTLLLALMIFLITAPAPDAATIQEMTHNLIVPDSETSLQAADALPAREDVIDSDA